MLLRRGKNSYCAKATLTKGPGFALVLAKSLIDSNVASTPGTGLATTEGPPRRPLISAADIPKSAALRFLFKIADHDDRNPCLPG